MQQKTRSRYVNAGLKRRVTCLFITLLLLPIGAMAEQGVYRFQTRSGKDVVVSETHPRGVSLSTIRVVSQGFESELDDTIYDSDPLSRGIVADLDENGFDELYLLTVSAGSGSYGNILAYASNRDRSLSRIHFPAIVVGDDHFAGYRGHDRFSFRTHRLIREFPVYREDDANYEPTGGRRVIYYELVPGEAMWQLVIVGSKQLDR